MTMALKKYHLFALLGLLVSIFAFSRASATIQELPLLGRIIYVDPGHGGRDPGTLSGTLYEKDINLEISLELRDQLMEKGAIVYMTRETDEDLSSQWDDHKKRGDLYRRLLLYKSVPTELYLSIHINADKNTSSKGIEVLYSHINPQNKVLGETLMRHFEKNFENTRNVITTDLYMYSNTTVPGVLIECGFLSNADERYLLQKKSYQKKLASSITDGVIEYLLTKPKDKSSQQK